jgi:CBS domain containing-hemolysin-like protein
MHEAGKVPEVGTHLQVGACSFEVLSGDEKRVGTVRIERVDG